MSAATQGVGSVAVSGTATVGAPGAKDGEGGPSAEEGVEGDPAGAVPWPEPPAEEGEHDDAMGLLSSLT